jgi:hypothetical protein
MKTDYDSNQPIEVLIDQIEDGVALAEPYLSNIKEATSQILYTLWNSRTRNSSFRPLIQRLYMCH